MEDKVNIELQDDQEPKKPENSEVGASEAASNAKQQNSQPYIPDKNQNSTNNQIKLEDEKRERIKAMIHEMATKENAKKKAPRPPRNTINYQPTKKRNRTAYLRYDTAPYYVVTQSEPHKGIVAKIVCQAAPPGTYTMTIPTTPIAAGPNMQTSIVNPMRIGLLPSEIFSLIDFPISLASFQVKYFQNRSSRVYRFEHKIYNALKITKEAPQLKGFIGVWWKTPDTFIVNVPVFVALFGSAQPRAALCHASGLFAVHGFEDVTSQMTKEYPNDMNSDDFCAYRHTSGEFTMTMTEEQLEKNCKWENPQAQPQAPAPTPAPAEETEQAQEEIKIEETEQTPKKE